MNNIINILELFISDQHLRKYATESDEETVHLDLVRKKAKERNKDTY